MNKNIVIKIELPVTWMDLNESANSFGLLDTSLTRDVVRILREELVKKYLEKIPLPEIEIDKEDIKREIIEQMAQRALSKIGNE